MLESVMIPAKKPPANIRRLNCYFKALCKNGKNIALATENLILILNEVWSVVFFGSLSPV